MSGHAKVPGIGTGEDDAVKGEKFNTMRFTSKYSRVFFKKRKLLSGLDGKLSFNAFFKAARLSDKERGS